MDQAQELMGIARELGRDRFLPRASAFDRAGEFPTANYEDLADAGFLGLTIPKRYGGLGADFATYAAVSAELGSWCGATALTFNMHTSSMLWSGSLADDLGRGDDVFQNRVVHGCKRAVARPQLLVRVLPPEVLVHYSAVGHNHHVGTLVELLLQLADKPPADAFGFTPHAVGGKNHHRVLTRRARTRALDLLG